MNKLNLILLLVLIGCGQTGPAGKDGVSIQGVSGYNTLMTFTRQSHIDTCDNSGVIVANGLDINRNSLLEVEEIQVISYICDGTDGTDGINGRDGTDGTNGIDGKDGLDGTNAESSEFEIINIITPCGFKPGIFNESLLELRNGDIVSFFEKGNNRFLNILQPGNYETQDAKKCKFYIDEKGEYHE